jgi:hypothetical protein
MAITATSTTAVPPVTSTSPEIRHDQLFEEIFKRFDKIDQEKKEDKQQRTEEKRKKQEQKEADKQQRTEEKRKKQEQKEAEKQQRTEEKRKKQERNDAEKQQREDEARKVEEGNAQMWRVLEEGKYLQFFSHLMWTHKGIMYCTIHHVKSE